MNNMNVKWFGVFAITLLLANIIGLETVLSLYKDREMKVIESLVMRNDSLEMELRKYEEFGVAVKVTMYQPVRRQTDSTPNILADGTRIRTQEASNYKYIAVSRNLLRRFGGWLDYGDFILLRGTDHKDGVYQVRDTMNKRFVNRIDILESPNVNPYMFPYAEIVKLDWVTSDKGT
jgi:3D (Asp-Asp-Asp) domain-containing protein